MTRSRRLLAGLMIVASASTGAVAVGGAIVAERSAPACPPISPTMSPPVSPPGCPPADKVTGGGTVVLKSGRVTFGTNVIYDGQGLRGNLQVNDHSLRARFHGYSVTSLSVSDNTARWTGEGRWNGEDGYTFVVMVEDNRNGNSAKKGDPDVISVVIEDSDGDIVWELSPSDLSGGNIRIHK